MFRRVIKLSHSNSFFLFGPRGTGKTTLIKQLFSNDHVLWIDLLKDEDEEKFRINPDLLSEILANNPYEWVVIDEVQKIPKLLDIIHLEIEKKKTKFVLTGSSARKLKRGAANLLAGRAFTYQLYPLCHIELGDSFQLEDLLQFGSLPHLYELTTKQDRIEFLRSYVKTYLKEEILSEQLIRKVDPFRDFLEVSAQTNGQIISYEKIADDLGVDGKTVQTYFQILEDTLLGFKLESYHRSVRKRQRVAPKFYLFDLGIKRALDHSMKQELQPETYDFGQAFEHFIILETQRLNEYFRLDFKMSYLRTKDGAEIDLIIERPGEATILVEIKSTKNTTSRHTSHLERFYKDWGKTVEAHLWSLDPHEKKIGNVICLPWKKGLSAAGFRQN
ncbi:MAG: ATP-binding protein [Deltaproteobacteria bacterium]|nr:ATP-binding protein [Deltaproteobacteria bacterium]